MRMKSISKSGDRDSVTAFKSLMKTVAEEVKIALNNLDEMVMETFEVLEGNEFPN